MVATEGFPPGHNGEGRYVCRASQPVSGIDGICLVENTLSVVWEPGKYTTLAPWYPRNGRLGLTRSNQSASHRSKNRELWLPFLTAAYELIGGGNQSWPEWRCLEREWWVLWTRRMCMWHAWIPGWVVLHNRVYLLSTASIFVSEM